MKNIFYFIILFSNISFSSQSSVYETSIQNGRWVTKKKQLEGIGFSLIAPVKIEEEKNETTGIIERKITVNYNNCKNIKILDDARGKTLKSGDYIKFRVSDASCTIGAWEAYK